jgi:DNA repair exonuclease SbcCD ATPase subunit
MKKLFVVIFVVAGLASCKNKELENEVQLLREQNEALMAQNFDQDSVLADYMGVFGEISDNLSEIRSRESSIELATESKATNAKEKIMEDIQAINSLMEQNRLKIEELDKKLKSSYGANAKLKQAMEKLKQEFTAQLEAKDQEISVLKEDLAKMNFTIQELNTAIAGLSATNAEKDAMLAAKAEEINRQVLEKNTAFYTVGTPKKLLEDKIITKEGGFIGIGRSKQISADMNLNSFTKVDIRELKSIPVTGKKASLVTTHPDGSYRFEGDGKKGVSSLVILDNERFWNSSKYLVVMVD